MSPTTREILSNGTFFCCGGNGFDAYEMPGNYLYSVPCSCGERKTEASLLERAQKALGAQFTLDSYRRDDNPAAYDAILTISKTWQCGAYLVGPTGTGKTHLAKALIFSAISAGKRARYIHAARFGKMFSDLPGHDQDSEDARIELAKLKASKVVVIDDLGSQRKTDSGVFEEGLQLFLDEFQGLIIVTTNLGGEQMQHAIGRKNLSRLAERCAKVEFRGKDQRSHPIIGAVRVSHD